jgi:magnesium transporter
VLATRPHLIGDPEVLTYLDEALREQILDILEPGEIARAMAELDSDDALGLVEDLDEEKREAVLDALPARERLLVEEGLTFPEYSAGRLMQREVVAVPMFWTVGKAIDWLREARNLPDDFHIILAVDPAYRPTAILKLSHILRNRRSAKLRELSSEEIRTIPAEMDQEEVALMFRQYGLVSAPVVDGAGRLIGVITVDDVVDVIDEEAEDDMLKLGGVSGDDLYRATIDTTRARFSWLAVNLLTAIVASGVIAIFESTIEQVVALAVLMPIVASMGGNAGTQSLTVAVRAIAVRELTGDNARRVLSKEVLVGLLNGVIFAVIAGPIAAFWFGDVMIGVVIGSAMILTLICAGFSGTVIPLLLERLKVDPAVASAVFLTTVTDVVGFFAFLGLAAWILI